MDYYHSIFWPMVSYHWKTIVCNGWWSCWKTIVTIPSFDHRKKLKNHQTQLYMDKNQWPFQRAEKLLWSNRIKVTCFVVNSNIQRLFKGTCPCESFCVCDNLLCQRVEWGDHIIRTQLVRGEDTAEGHTSYLSFFLHGHYFFQFSSNFWRGRTCQKALLQFRSHPEVYFR